MKALKYIGFGIIALSIISCSNDDTKTTETTADTNSATVERVYPVRTSKIGKQIVNQTLEHTANLVAYKEIHFAPATPVRINKIYVEIGSRIKEGQLLVETDKTQLLQAQTQLANARSNFQRIDTLFKLGSISEQQHEQMKTQYDLAKSNVQFLSENTTLRSPIDGIVTGKYFENGELYSGAPNTQAGKAAVLSLMQINPMKAIVSISQSYYPNIKEGMTTEILSDVYPSKTFKGRISKVYPTINAATRSFEVEVIIDNPQEILRPGMFARINLNIGNAETLIVPASAVLRQEGTNSRYVFINDDNIAKQIFVKTGKRHNHLIEIESPDIKEGMDLIVEGQANLLNDYKIRIVTDTTSAISTK
jgi:membrane fusion protein, multidrug efflux system